MKKSLSFLLAIAMVFGLFASVVSAADNADLTAQQKFDALKAKGIFAGKGADQDPALSDSMTRAEGARIIALLKGLEGIGDPDTRVVTEKPFPDVDLGKWYTEEIDAVKEDGSFKGNADGTFNPDGQFTVQELAVAVAQALGFDAVNAPAVEIEGAASWAGSSIQFLLDNGYTVPTNYTEPALRGQLVEAAYVADSILNPDVPANIGITEAKASGAKKVTVKLNGPADTAKAKLDVKRENSSAALDGDPEWSSDGKSVTLTLASKIITANYSVTLSGIDNLDKDKASASFEGQAEKITTIDITTASDTLPLNDGVRVDFEAKNQYGEVSDLPASNFVITTGGSANWAPVAGSQAVTLDLVSTAPPKAKGDKVPLTIIYTDSNAQANKIFTIGDPAIVSKVEVGELLNKDNEKIDSIAAGTTAYLEFSAYDQYGIRVSKLGQLNGSTGVTVVIPDNNLIKGDDPAATPPPTDSFVANIVGDYADDLAISAISGASAKEITLSFFANGTGQSVQKVVRVSTPKVPATVEFGDFTSTIAVDDTNIKVPLIVKDAAGDTLSAQDIADNAGKFTVYATGGVVTVLNAPASIETSGTNKGKLNIASANFKGNGTIVIQLTDNPNAKSQLNVSVVDKRKADRIAVSQKAADKLLTIAGVGEATSTLKLKTFDQYNGDRKETDMTASYVKLHIEKLSGADADAAVLDLSAIGESATFKDLDADIQVDLDTLFDKALVWTAQAGKSGTVKLTATLYQVKTGGDVELYKVTSQVTVYDGKSANLTYSVVLDGAADSTLFAATKYKSAWALPSDAPVLKKSIVVSAKEGSSTVALPSGVVQSVTSSNPSVADAVYADVLGHASGTVDLNVLFTTPTGASTASVQVTVKEELPVIKSISRDNGSATGDTVKGASAYMGGLKVKDQYGNEYDYAAFTSTSPDYAALLNLRFFLSNVKYASGNTGSISINASTGAITYTGGAGLDLEGFTVNIIAPSGATASTEVMY